MSKSPILAITAMMIGIVMLPACRDISANNVCYKRLMAEKLFIGTEYCLSKLRTKNISGYVSIGPEESVFFLSRRQLDDFLSSETKPSLLTWFDKGEWRPNSSEPSSTTNQRVIYKVEFDGKPSDEAGLYGHMGLYGSAILLKKMKRYTFERKIVYNGQ